VLHLTPPLSQLLLLLLLLLLLRARTLLLLQRRCFCERASDTAAPLTTLLHA
jgi:hypothetical protein